MKRNSTACLAVAILTLATSSPMITPLAYACINCVVATVTVGTTPFGVGVNPVTNLVYVANIESGTVSVISGATNTVVATVPVGGLPLGVGVNAVTNLVYVTNGGGSGYVSVISGATNTVVATVTVVPLGGEPYAVGVNTETNLIYVAHVLDFTVSVIDGATNSQVAIVPVGAEPDGVGVNTNTNRIYVANAAFNTVSVIDGSTNAVPVATVPVGDNPVGVGVNPATNLIYVTNAGGNTVSVISGATNTVVATVTVGTDPRGVGVNPVTNMIYVTNDFSNTVSVISGVTNLVVGTVPAGIAPVGVGVNPVTNLIYVSNQGPVFGNTVTVIAGAAPTINVSEFFTDSSLNRLPSDVNGSPTVNVTLAKGIVKSTNPGQVLAWVNVTNTSGSSLKSLKLDETLPVDWAVDPAWTSAVGAIHVFYANTTSLATNPEITQPSTISVSTGNPQSVHLAIDNLTSTAIGHSLMPGQSVLLSVKLTYGLIKTRQSAISYPRSYADAAIAAAWTQASFTGSQFTGTASAFFIADAKVVS